MSCFSVGRLSEDITVRMFPRQFSIPSAHPAAGIRNRDWERAGQLGASLETTVHISLRTAALGALVGLPVLKKPFSHEQLTVLVSGPIVLA